MIRTLSFLIAFVLSSALGGCTPSALRYERLTYDQAVKQNLRFMDQAAIALCRENRLPIVVFDMTVSGNIRKVVSGEVVGTTVTDE